MTTRAIPKEDGRDAALARLLLRAEIEDFYYAEASLLDERRYSDWLALFTEDTRYWIPTRQNRMQHQMQGETSGEEGTALADDDRWALELKVRQRESAKHWCENPCSRTRHLVTNVRIHRVASDEVEVKSSFLVYRNRAGDDVDLWAGERTDTLRRVAGSYRIARRYILLDQGVLLSKNLSVFF
ncbi:3-phenylpropionate/cinnamic acid dioxygenase subunit beta [Polyangium sp. y55x31]|uniref:aromatic-ring-hydroxylating dioxygenase subunit beta n=1 Tax=Polyangium sp. y55x31 TaxID=3042688 RepID=UPI002482CF66|nr:3-phenylpropionate/cinnamic acid dioxygenase subunit beta [Polyangium sp. y55x31]MDI1477144.1 3-phenylpropionate/cinnamic acid dioxygenase subunit beta [Polyangium sp. y55x31]